MKIRTADGVHETQRERVYHRVKLALMSGDYEPGQKITIAAVAAALGVSATPVREALRRLAAERALAMYPNRSVVVPKLSREEVLAIRAIREQLEGFAVKLAAGRIDEERLERLRRVQLALTAARARGNARRILHLNEKFHFMVYDTAGIQVLTDIISTLWLHSQPTLNLLFKPQFIARYPLAIQNRNNRALIRALRERDGKRAAAAVMAEIAVGSRMLGELMAETARGERRPAKRRRPGSALRSRSR